MPDLHKVRARFKIDDNSRVRGRTTIIILSDERVRISWTKQGEEAVRTASRFDGMHPGNRDGKGVEIALVGRIDDSLKRGAINLYDWDIRLDCGLLHCNAVIAG